MKKTTILVLTFALAASLAGCGEKPAKPDPSESITVSVSSAETSSEISTEASTETSTETSAESKESDPVSAGSSNAPSDTNSSGTSVSDNMFDNQFSFNGILITMPTQVKTFQAFDLKLPADKESFMLNPKTFTSGALESLDGDKRIAVGFYNLGSEVIKLSESMVSSVNLQSKYFKDDLFVFSQGIAFGSTMDEVKAAYGEPTDFIDGDAGAKVLRETMKYENPADHSNYYEFYFEDKVLISVQLYVSKK